MRSIFFLASAVVALVAGSPLPGNDHNAVDAASTTSTLTPGLQDDEPAATPSVSHLRKDMCNSCEFLPFPMSIICAADCSGGLLPRGDDSPPANMTTPTLIPSSEDRPHDPELDDRPPNSPLPSEVEDHTAETGVDSTPKIPTPEEILEADLRNMFFEMRRLGRVNRNLLRLALDVKEPLDTKDLEPTHDELAKMQVFLDRWVWVFMHRPGRAMKRVIELRLLYRVGGQKPVHRIFWFRHFQSSLYTATERMLNPIIAGLSEEVIKSVRVRVLAVEDEAFAMDLGVTKTHDADLVDDFTKLFPLEPKLAANKAQRKACSWPVNFLFDC